MKSSSSFETENLIPVDNCCHFRLTGEVFAKRDAKCFLCSSFAEITRLYKYSPGDPFQLAYGKDRGKTMKISREKMIPFLRPRDLPKGVLLSGIGETHPLALDKIEPWTDCDYFEADSFTRSLVTGWFAEELFPGQILERPMGGFCGPDAMSIGEASSGLETFHPEDLLDALDQAMVLVEKGSDYGFHFDGTEWRVTETPTSVKLKLDHGGSTLGFPKGERFTRLIPRLYPESDPVVRFFDLESDRGMESWFQIESKMPALGVPTLQSTVNTYITLLQFLDVGGDREEFRKLRKHFFRGEYPTSILNTPMRSEAVIELQDMLEEM